MIEHLRSPAVPALVLWSLTELMLSIRHRAGLMKNRFDAWSRARFSKLVLYAVVAIGAAACSEQEDASPVFVISNVTVIPMTPNDGSEEPVVLPEQSVVVRDGQIVAVGPTSSVEVPVDAEIIDGTGRFLIPGLIDMHVHFVDRNELEMFLAYGVTTVRNMGDFPEDTTDPASWRNHVYYGSTVEVRDRVRSGEWLGPDMYLAGHMLDGPEATIRGGTTPIARVEDIEGVVRREREQGYDFIKIYDSIPHDHFSRIFEVARAEGMHVVGHAPLAMSYAEVLTSGLYSNEHLTMFRRYEEVAPIMDEVGTMVAETGMWSCPTLIGLSHAQRPGTEAFEVFFDELEWRYLSPETKALVRTFLSDPNYEVFAGEYVDIYFRPLTSILAGSGARIVVGSDAPIGALPGVGVHQELELLVSAGMSPYQALRAATSDAALALERESTFGTIESGRRADLVLLAANPLEDVSRTRSIEGVMVRGHWLSRAAIDQTLEHLATR